MHIDILTVVPDLLKSPLDHSIVKRAREAGLVDIHIHNIRDFAANKYKSVDDYAFGGGAGMVMMIEPIVACMESLTAQRKYDEIIYLSPDGELFDQRAANKISLMKNIMLLCGHYKGIDERIREHFITMEISIGNYVLSLTIRAIRRRSSFGRRCTPLRSPTMVCFTLATAPTTAFRCSRPMALT
jgi:tRNA (guanine37-N1)-methyltransferase